MAVTVVVIVGMASHFLQEMEMGEKPKKAPEQTAMVKMGMLGTLTIFTTVIFTIIMILTIFTAVIFITILLEGVFMPCLLNIWGVMLFLR